jgi:hypothetical protein
MSQTMPFQVVTGVSITPKQPFSSLYQHITQRDPKLHETLDRLAQPADLTNNLSNPLQALNFVFLKPMPSSKTNWANIVSNVPTDQSMYFPVLLIANVDAVSSTDIIVDIQISHIDGVSFITILNAPIKIPAGSLGPIQVLNFAQGAYLRNLDFVFAELTSVAFDGGNITVTLLFQ